MRHVTHMNDMEWLHTVSSIDKIIGLFCEINIHRSEVHAKETYNLIDPTNQSHPLHPAHVMQCVTACCSVLQGVAACCSVLLTCNLRHPMGLCHPIRRDMMFHTYLSHVAHQEASCHM